ncbi:MAG TPA: 50S ribosomal protein L11 methyltransferase [Patescibacteria group bacterium]|nr:50S ribosomal protein L11 methyltransferase [Patescibacteria group bacterium]
MEIINIILLIFIGFLLIILSWVWPPDSPWSPWWRTNGKKAMAAATLANITENDLVYELGSGDATFLVVASKKFGAQSVGIEIDPTRHIIAMINVKKNKLGKKVKLKKANFFEEDLSSATVVFVYLVPRVLEKLKPKLLKELKKGTRVVSFNYEFPSASKDSSGPELTFVQTDKENKMHLYKVS